MSEIAQEVAPGLFAVEEEMPCEPSDIRVTHYELPGAATLGRAERDEAAARILSFSQKAGRWVGVSSSRLDEVMDEEYAVSQVIAHARKSAKQAEKVYKRLRILTCGLFPKFTKWPMLEVCEIATKAIPRTSIYFTGRGFVEDGLEELVESGMLRKVEVADEYQAGVHVFFPTPALVSLVSRRRKVVAEQKA